MKTFFLKHIERKKGRSEESLGGKREGGVGMRKKGMEGFKKLILKEYFYFLPDRGVFLTSSALGDVPLTPYYATLIYADNSMVVL